MYWLWLHTAGKLISILAMAAYSWPTDQYTGYGYIQLKLISILAMAAYSWPTDQYTGYGYIQLAN